MDPRPFIDRLPFPDSAAVGWYGRMVALGVAVACLALLVTARRVTPSPAGLGSHTQLGLAPCQFLRSTGVPAPSCGMTTSFSWFVRGNVAASLYVQPMGTVLALGSAASVLGGLYIALSGRPLHRLVYLVPPRYLLVPILAGAVLAWAWKIFIHLNGIDGWR